MTPTRDGAVTTRAVVLRRVDYRESDRIVTLFTESLGKVGAIARAARAGAGDGHRLSANERR